MTYTTIRRLDLFVLPVVLLLLAGAAVLLGGMDAYLPVAIAVVVRAATAPGMRRWAEAARTRESKP